MTWDYVYRDDVSESDEYSDKYVSQRIAHEHVHADRVFVANSPSDSNSQLSHRQSKLEDQEAGTQASQQGYATARIQLSESSATPPPSRAKVRACHFDGCGKRYYGVEAHVNLRRHIRCTHESDASKTFKCPGTGCELETARRDNLRVHFLKKHGEEEMPPWLENKKRSRANMA